MQDGQLVEALGDLVGCIGAEGVEEYGTTGEHVLGDDDTVPRDGVDVRVETGQRPDADAS